MINHSRVLIYLLLSIWSTKRSLRLLSPELLHVDTALLPCRTGSLKRLVVGYARVFLRESKVMVGDKTKVSMKIKNAPI